MPQGLAVEADPEDGVQPAVEVREEVVLGPFQPEGVEPVGEVAAADGPAGGGAPVGVGGFVWAC